MTRAGRATPDCRDATLARRGERDREILDKQPQSRSRMTRPASPFSEHIRIGDQLPDFGVWAGYTANPDQTYPRL
jgi:hypothetical protein